MITTWAHKLWSFFKHSHTAISKSQPQLELDLILQNASCGQALKKETFKFAHVSWLNLVCLEEGGLGGESGFQWLKLSTTQPVRADS